MSTVSPSPFEKAALASGLISQVDLDEARAALRWSHEPPPGLEGLRTGDPLADKLVELGRLNQWQASQLIQGRTKFNLGPYWILDGIGQGGMGQVFKAEHEASGAVVAIKVLPRSRSTPEAVENFAREIQATAQLNHPNLVRAIDSGHDGNVHYLVTEYVPGMDLRKLVRRRGPLGMHEAASLIGQVAQGLQHAHEQGIIHRDVKPGNVLVSPEGVAKLSDLGLAGPLEGAAQSDPRFGKIVGTADYLSPDHIRSPWDPKPAWDIYSLGCTLYYAVTGKVPYPGGSTADKARAHCELVPLNPRQLNSKLSAAFVDVLADMMAKDPAERIATAAEVVRRLQPWTDPQLAAADAESAQRRPPVRKRPEVLAGARPGPLDDTQASFPEMPVVATQPASSEQVSQTTYPVAWGLEDTRSTLEMRRHAAGQRVSVLGPLLILVGIPVLLVSSVLLTCWLLELFAQ